MFGRLEKRESRWEGEEKERRMITHSPYLDVLKN
jgi:hypothetical protein